MNVRFMAKLAMVRNFVGTSTVARAIRKMGAMIRSCNVANAVRTMYQPTSTSSFAVRFGQGIGDSVSTNLPEIVAPAVIGGFNTQSGDRVAILEKVNGPSEIAVGDAPGALGNGVSIYSHSGQLLRRVEAYEQTYDGGVHITAGDFTGDGNSELVVGTDLGGGPRVQMFDGATGALLVNYFAIDDANFRGGVRVGAGDINGDGRADLVVSAGFGGGPRIAIFDGAALAEGRPVKMVGDYFAFDSSLRNGAFVAVADVNGDGYGDVVHGAGPGGGPRVLVTDGFQTANGRPMVEIMNYFAGPSENRNGVHVGAIDSNGDRKYEVLAGSGPHDPSAYYLTGIDGPIGNFGLGAGDLGGGVYVDGGDVNGDGREDAVVAFGNTVQIVDFGGPTTLSAYAGDPNNNFYGLGSQTLTFSGITSVTGTAGTTQTFTLAANRPNVELRLIQGDQNVAVANLTGNTLTVSLRNPGTTVFRVEGYINGKLDGSIDIPVTTGQAVIAGVPPTCNLQIGQSATFTFTTNPPGSQVRVIVPNGSGVTVTSQLDKIIINANATGTWPVRLEILAADGRVIGVHDFTVVVTPVPNGPPQIAAIADQSLFVGQNGVVTFQVFDPNSPPQQLTVSVSSSDPNVVPMPTLGGSGSNLTASVTPGAVGASTITILVTDPQGLTATETFVVTVPNRAPSITDVPNVTMTAGQNGSTNFGAVDSDNQNVTVTASSNNQSVLPNGSIVITGTGNNRTVTIQAGSATGTAIVTLTATDPFGATAVDTFVVTVNPGTPSNTPPTISNIADVTLPAGQTASGVFQVNDAETNPNNLNVTASSSNPNIATVSVSGTGGTRNISVTTNASAPVGSTATMTVTVTDAGGLTATDTFVVTVTGNTGSGITVDVSLRNTPGPDVHLSPTQWLTTFDFDIRRTSAMSFGPAFLHSFTLQTTAGNNAATMGVALEVYANVGTQHVLVSSGTVGADGTVTFNINQYLVENNATLFTVEARPGAGSNPAASFQFRWVGATVRDQNGNDIPENVLGQYLGAMTYVS